jgi:hypothetical protein
VGFVVFRDLATFRWFQFDVTQSLKFLKHLKLVGFSQLFAMKTSFLTSLNFFFGCQLAPWDYVVLPFQLAADAKERAFELCLIALFFLASYEQAQLFQVSDQTSQRLANHVLSLVSTDLFHRLKLHVDEAFSTFPDEGMHFHANFFASCCRVSHYDALMFSGQVTFSTEDFHFR